MIDPYSEGLLMSEAEVRLRALAAELERQMRRDRAHPRLAWLPAWMQLLATRSCGSPSPPRLPLSAPLLSLPLIPPPFLLQICELFEVGEGGLQPCSFATMLAGILTVLRDSHWCAAVGCPPEPLLMVPVSVEVRWEWQGQGWGRKRRAQEERGDYRGCCGSA